MNKLYLFTFFTGMTPCIMMHASDNNNLAIALNNKIVYNAKTVNRLIEKRNSYNEESLTCLGYLCCMPYIHNCNRRIQSLCNETNNLIAIQAKIKLMEPATGKITTEIDFS